MYHANINQKKVGVATLIFDKLDVKAKKITETRTLYNNKGSKHTTLIEA